MKEFFRKRRLHFVYFFVSILVWLSGVIIENLNVSEKISIGIGDPLHYSGWILMCMLLLMFFLPKKVFSAWKFISIPFILYIIIEALKMPIFGDCTPVGCNDRDTFVAFGSFVLGSISLIISIVLALIWHFVEKYRLSRK